MMKYMIKDVASMAKYLPWGLLIGIPAGVLVLGVRNRGKKKDTGETSAVPVIVFSVYAALIGCITYLSRESGCRTGLDLQLFSTWGINDRNNAYVVENILLFIPFGLLCCWAFPKARKLMRSTLVGLLTSLAIESLQLATGRGYFQIDDILTNTIGAIIGYLLFRILHGMFRKRSK